MKSPGSAQYSSAAFTLLETLLAIAIGGLTIFLIFSIYHTTMNVVHGQALRQKGVVQSAEALSQLSRQLTCSMIHEGREDLAFELVPAKTSDSGFPELSFVFAEPASGRRQEWHRTHFNRVHLESRPDQLYNLIGILMPVSGPAQEVTNVLITAVKTMDIEVFDGTDWQNQWPIPEAPALPRAIRIKIEPANPANARPLETEIFIPAGNIIVPSIEHTSG